MMDDGHKLHREEDSNFRGKGGAFELSVSSGFTNDGSNNLMLVPKFTDKRFSNDLGSLYGRDEEVKLLQGTFLRTKELERTQVVLVHGQSGTGKTRLVEASLRSYATEKGGCFVTGKFDQMQRIGESFSALRSAFSDICDLLVSSTQRDEITESLETELGAEAETLTTLIPNLSYLLSIQTSLGDGESLSSMEATTNETSVGGISKKGSPEATVRLTQLCRSFLRVVATADHSVVLFFDDVQWAERNSLSIIQGLMKDSELRHVMIVAAYRDEDGHHEDLMRDLFRRKLPNVVDLTVKNLQSSLVTQMVADFSGRTPEEARGLGEFVFQSTDGNVYFVLQLLDQINRDHVLSEDFLFDNSWSLDYSSKKGKLDVGSLIKAKIRMLSSTLQTTLQLAAFLGFQFDVGILDILVRSRESGLVSCKTGERRRVDSRLRLHLLRMALDVAVVEGLLRKRDELSYCFSHDRVQSCLHNMACDSDVKKESLHLKIGKDLAKVITPENKGQLLMLATDHMNMGGSLIDSYQERMDLVRLNVDAGNLALQCCEYGPALLYHRNATAMLKDCDSWESHYTLSLDAFAGLAYSEFCNGSTELCGYACYEALGHGRTIWDKMRVYPTLILSLNNQKVKLKEAVEIGVMVLRSFGEKLPLRPRLFDVARELFRVRRNVRRIGDGSLPSLPLMRDERKLAAMTILNRISASVYLDQDSRQTFIVVALRMLHLTCRYGHNDWTPFAFSLYLGVESSLGRLEVGRRYLNIARELIEKARSKEAKTQALYAFHSLLSTWTEPLRGAFEGFMRGYKLGFECGETQFALYNGSMASAIGFHIDVGLVNLEKHSRELCKQMREFKSYMILRIALISRQLVLSFMTLQPGEQDPLKLTGEAMDEDQFLLSIRRDSDATMPYFAFRVVRFYLVLCFDGWDLLEEVLDGFARYRAKTARGHFTTHITFLFQGLAAFSLCHHHHHHRRRISKRKQHRIRREALVCARQLEVWLDCGVIACLPSRHMLTAEKMVIFGYGQEEVMRQYDTAIAWANQMKNRFWEALFAKRAFEAVYHIYGDDQAALSYLRLSIGLFSKWGAQGVVEFLQSKYADILPTRS